MTTSRVRPSKTITFGSLVFPFSEDIRQGLVEEEPGVLHYYPLEPQRQTLRDRADSPATPPYSRRGSAWNKDNEEARRTVRFADATSSSSSSSDDLTRRVAEGSTQQAPGIGGKGRAKARRQRRERGTRTASGGPSAAAPFVPAVGFYLAPTEHGTYYYVPSPGAPPPSVYTHERTSSTIPRQKSQSRHDRNRARAVPTQAVPGGAMVLYAALPPAETHYEEHRVVEPVADPEMMAQSTVGDGEPHPSAEGPSTSGEQEADLRICPICKVIGPDHSTRRCPRRCVRRRCARRRPHAEQTCHYRERICRICGGRGHGPASCATSQE